jgi:uncharacterized protein (DUF2252 family)
LSTTAAHRQAERATVAERRARGKAARSEVPRSSHAEWSPRPRRRKPVVLLNEQARSRVQSLLPIRYGRMAASPFAFFRGAAYVMAADLAHTPRSGIRVQLCGDAHLSNFGAFAAPDRRLVFDLNDFDETLPGPWEWDVKRLAASLVVASRQRDFEERDRRRIVTRAVQRYRETMRAFAGMRDLDVWYARIDAEDTLTRIGDQLDPKVLKQVARNTAKARRKDSMRALAKLTREVDGQVRFISDPPLVVPASELLEAYGLADRDSVDDRVRALLSDYAATLSRDARQLVQRYEYADIARKVVGVGSVGTRAWIVLALGRDNTDPLVLQVKEAQRSVLEPFSDPSEHDLHGQRVVEGQRLMQASGDPLLGWLKATGLDGKERDYYVRQLWDWKLSADVDAMSPDVLAAYGQLCAASLARAHARSGDRIAIAAYLGGGDAFDRALAEFAEAYADQNERDHAALVGAIEDGRVAAEPGV